MEKMKYNFETFRNEINTDTIIINKSQTAQTIRSSNNQSFISEKMEKNLLK